MNIGVEISLYPLQDEYIPSIKAFIDRLDKHPGLRITTNSMSTQVFGEYALVMNSVMHEIRRTFEEPHRSVFVMKVLGAFEPT